MDKGVGEAEAESKHTSVHVLSAGHAQLPRCSMLLAMHHERTWSRPSPQNNITHAHTCTHIGRSGPDLRTPHRVASRARVSSHTGRTLSDLI